MTNYEYEQAQYEELLDTPEARKLLGNDQWKPLPSAPMMRDLAEAYGLWRLSYEYCGLQAFRHGWISKTEEEAFLLLESKTQTPAEVRSMDEVTRGMQAVPGHESGSSASSPATAGA